MDTYDVVVVGGGPNGLYAAYRLRKKFPNKRILLVEKGRTLNHLRQIPDVLWHSTMGELKLPSYLNDQIIDVYNPVTSELVRYYEAFAAEHALEIREHHELFDVSKTSNPSGRYELELKTPQGGSSKILCKTVFMSTGNFLNSRTLDTKCDYPFCSFSMNLNDTGKNLVLIGAGNSAADFVIHLLEKNRIHWVIRGEEWRSINSNRMAAFESAVEKHANNLTVYRNSTVKQIAEDRRVVLADGREISDVDGCHILVGYHSKNSLFDRIGLEYDHECLKLGPSYETNLPDIYAFGSVMARWDASKQAPAPTYVHNGNDRQLEIIIQDMIRKELASIMTCTIPEPAPAKPKGNLVDRAVRRLSRTLSNRAGRVPDSR